MSPLTALAWVGVAAAALLVLGLAVEAMRPTRRLVRVDVADHNGVLLSTGTYLVGEERMELRAGDLRVSAETVQRRPARLPETVGTAP